MEEKTNNSEVNALETPEKASDSKEEVVKKSPAKTGLNQKIRGLISHLNIYLLIFVFIIILCLAIVAVGVRRGIQDAAGPGINSTELTKESLAKIQGTDAKVGDAKQTLRIESNAEFSNKVLFRNNVDVAGTLKLGGPLDLPGITVAGVSTFDQIQGNKLAITGDGIVQGQLTVQKNLTVSAGASFGGPISAPSITVQTFNLSGDLQFSRHVDAGGATPTITSYGAGLGSGGTASVNGTDSAGTITLNIGGSPSTNSCFVTINFANSFNSTPHMVVTPTSSGGAGLQYYLTRNSTSFSLCSTSGTPSGNLTFDYIAFD